MRLSDSRKVLGFPTEFQDDRKEQRVVLQKAGKNTKGRGKPLYNSCVFGEIPEVTGGVKSY
jgi:hypothetical protein